MLWKISAVNKLYKQYLLGKAFVSEEENWRERQFTTITYTNDGLYTSLIMQLRCMRKWFLTKKKKVTKLYLYTVTILEL